MSHSDEQERPGVTTGAEQPPETAETFRDPAAPPPVSVYDRPEGLARLATWQIALFVLAIIIALFIAYQLIF